MSVYYKSVFQRAFGTYPLTGDAALAAIKCAAELGYRAFDTAQAYDNEGETGRALAATGLPRDALCVTTKVAPSNMSDVDFLPSVEVSLEKLGLDFVDVLLIHWPPADGDIVPGLRQLQAAHDAGLTRHIGVSNFTVAMLETAADILTTPLATNQVEFHPLLNQDRLLDGANRLGVPLSAYCSVARGEVFKEPLFAALGDVYGKSAGQIVLRWILQKGVSINTMSTKPDNIRANFDVMDFTLSNADMARIDALTHRNFRIVTKDVSPFAPDWD